MGSVVMVCTCTYEGGLVNHSMLSCPAVPLFGKPEASVGVSWLGAGGAAWGDADLIRLIFRCIFLLLGLVIVIVSWMPRHCLAGSSQGAGLVARQLP